MSHKEIEVKSHDLEDFIAQVAGVAKQGGILATSQHAAGWYFATFVVGKVIDAVVDILDGDEPAEVVKPAKKPKMKAVAE